MWTTSTPYTIILLTAAAMTAFFAVYGFTRSRSPVALPFAGLAVVATFHALGSAFELASADLAGKIFWTRIEYIGIVFIPVFWLLLTARYSGKDKDLTKTVLGSMIFLSTLTLTLNYTNDWHHLYYTSLGLDLSGAFRSSSSARASGIGSTRSTSTWAFWSERSCSSPDTAAAP